MSDFIIHPCLRLCYERDTIINNMPQRDQDDIPYRGIVTSPASAPAVSSTNEANYDTLQIARKLLQDGIDGLYKDFNAFDILKAEDKEKASANLLRQVEAKQMAFDILSPVLEAVDNAVKLVDEKYKQR